jgi:O-antigen ligase
MVSRSERTLHAVGLACVALVILQIATSFLPYVRILRHWSTSRLLLLPAVTAVLFTLRTAEGRAVAVRKARDLAPLIAATACLYAWYLISALVRSAPSVWWTVDLLFEELVATAVLVLLVRDVSDLRLVTAVLLLALAVQSWNAVRQTLLREETYYYLVHRGGWTPIHSGSMPAGPFVVRATGLFMNPNVLGAWLAMLLPLAAVSLPDSRTGMRRLRIALLVLGAAALAVTFSRTAVIAAAVAGCAVLLSRRPRVALALVPVAAALLLNPLSIQRTATVLSRVAGWRVALDVIASSPLVGVGPGNFGGFVREAMGLDLFHAHNAFLQIAAEAGIAASLAFVAVLALVLRETTRVRRDPRLDMFGVALTASLATVIVGSFTDAAYNANQISYTFWLLVGLTAAAATLSREEDGRLGARGLGADGLGGCGVELGDGPGKQLGDQRRVDHAVEKA